jgi:hypothetical protein
VELARSLLDDSRGWLSEAARHTVGLARSLGYGRAKIEVVGWSVVDLQGRPVEREACVRAFVDRMEQHARETRVPGGWAHSRIIHELRALARPLPPGSREARAMRIDDPVYGNEFSAAKKQGMALHTAGDPTQWAAEAAAAGHRVITHREPDRVEVYIDRGQDHRGRGDRDGGRGRGPGPRGPAPGARRAPPPPVSLVRPVAATAWKALARGTRVEVELGAKNPKGKWRCKLVTHAVSSGVIEGAAPPEAAEGKRFTVEVIAGGDPKNLNLKWA